MVILKSNLNEENKKLIQKVGGTSEQNILSKDSYKIFWISVCMSCNLMGNRQ